MISLAVFFSCNKENSNDIPYVPVDVVINITNYAALNAPGGWAYVSGGVQGIVIYRQTLDQFFAIDRCCSYLPTNRNQVSVESGTFLKDPVCGSKFNMVDGGSVVSAPASRPLKRYNVTYDGNLTVHVYN